MSISSDFLFNYAYWCWEVRRIYSYTTVSSRQKER